MTSPPLLPKKLVIFFFIYIIAEVLKHALLYGGGDSPKHVDEK